jgi:uroporphyrinogen decarboxylase
MNSRERILAAYAHKESDVVPIDFNGHRSSGIMVRPYMRLREALGLPKSPLYVYDFIQQLALVEDDVLEIVGADVVELGHNYCNRADYWKDWELEDGTPCKIPAFIEVKKTKEGNIVLGDEKQVICIQKPGCLFFEQTCFPLSASEDSTFERLRYDLNQIMWVRLGIPPAPAGLDEAGLKEMAANAKGLRASADKAIYATFGGNLVEIGEFAFRIDNFLCLLAAEPKRMHAFLDKLVEYHLENMDRYLSAVGPFIDILGFGDDLGMQTGPQFSPQMYREFFKPRHQVLWNHAKKRYPHIHVSLHCCGGIYPLLPDMIEAGLEAVNPVQFTCKDMELPRLKREFGKDVVFWGGGCDTREMLSSGTPKQIEDHVRGNVACMRGGGGFVFQQVHNILDNVPPENIVAMFRSVRS